MKTDSGFLAGIEDYTWKLAKRSPLPYPYLVVGMAMVVLALSAFGKNINSAISMDTAIKMSTSYGDYSLAEKLLKESPNSLVLGANSEIDDLVYPERVVERKIEELENSLEKYPGNREIYLQLAGLNEQIGKSEQAQQYSEMARVLDPNSGN